MLLGFGTSTGPHNNPFQHRGGSVTLTFRNFTCRLAMEGGIRLENMYVLKIVVKVLVAFLALSLIAGSVSDDFGAQLSGPERIGLCLMTFGSIAVLHFLTWQFIVGKSALLGREPRSFIDLGGSKTFFSGLTVFGYMVLGLQCLLIAGFSALTELSFSGSSGKIYGLAFGLILIGLGLAAKLRLLLQKLQTIPK